MSRYRSHEVIAYNEVHFVSSGAHRSEYEVRWRARILQMLRGSKPANSCATFAQSRS